MPTIHKHGYQYTIAREGNGKLYFRCANRGGCAASTIFAMITGFEQWNEIHNHAPNPITRHVAKAKVVLAEQALSSPLERPNEIVTNVLSTIEDGNFLL